MSNFETLGGAFPRHARLEMATKQCQFCEYPAGHHPDCPTVKPKQK